MKYHVLQSPTWYFIDQVYNVRGQRKFCVAEAAVYDISRLPEGFVAKGGHEIIFIPEKPLGFAGLLK